MRSKLDQLRSLQETVKQRKANYTLQPFTPAFTPAQQVAPAQQANAKVATKTNPTTSIKLVRVTI